MKSIKTLALLTLIFGLAHAAMATPVDSNQAGATVKGWLKAGTTPLGAKLGSQIKKVESYGDPSNPKSGALYYVVYLQPQGFVIVAADDREEPIIAFVSEGTYDPSVTNPLGALINRDLPKRLAKAHKDANTTHGLANLAKWKKLQAPLSSTNSVQSKGIQNSSIADMRIAPFIPTLWNQAQSVDGGSCYNFFTPPYDAGNATNANCGCVATALAQLMYYYQYPTAGVGTNSFVISFDGTDLTRQLRGGDGKGGPYDWANMPLNPDDPATDQRAAIGSLTFDAAVSVHMQFTDYPGSSGAYMTDAQTALVSTFQYANAILTEATSINVGYDLLDMINANLDARRPVVFGIDNTAGGHCIICDGYGYDNYGTLYHHMNMGWGGQDNAWYQIPTLDLTDTEPYYNFDACLYNVYTNGSGEIISGRVLDQTGNPIANAGVTAFSTKGGVYSATTDVNGIYALPGLPSLSTCIIQVTNTGYFPASSNFVTGLSQQNGTGCGNIWGANFTLVTAKGAPLFTVQPISQTVTVGSNATFYAYATGALPLGYQWQYQSSVTLNWVNLTDNGTISGSQTPTLTINQTTLGMNGEPLQCVATNNQGSATSDEATLTVNPAPFIYVSTLAGTVGVPGTVDGLNFSALFNNPHGIAVDSRTNIFVADKNNHVIRMITPSVSGWSVVTIAGTDGVFGSSNGPGSSAEFNGPYGVAVDANDNVYVADTGNDEIRKLTGSGTNWTVTTIGGTAGSKGTTDGVNALFNLPMGITVDSSGNLYVADEGNHNIRKLTSLGGGSWIASTLAGSGTYGSNDGTNNSAQFGQPYGITVDNNGNVFVADEYNQTIRKLKQVSGNWVVTTIAGANGAAGNTDGVGSNARFKYPTGIASDGQGNLYVADSGNDTIRRMTLIGTNWTVSTVAGVAGSPGSMDGVGSGVLLNMPFDVAVNGGTNVYITDANNDTIRGPSQLLTPMPSVVHMVQMHAPQTLCLSWNAVSGHNYQIEYKTNLTQASWTYLSTVTASNWTGLATITVASDPQRYYRVVPAP